METSKNLSLNIVTTTSIKTDKIEDTLIGFGDNFKKIDKVLGNSMSSVAMLKVGTRYMLGERFWNSAPTIGMYIGWVNTREGIHATEWKPLKNYTLNETISAKPDNGNIYKCISEGRSMRNTPIFSTSANAEFYDAVGTNWMDEYNYDVNDVVFPTDGNKNFYFICETSGFSSEIEPNWDSVTSGTTTIDGSVVWRKQKAIRWQQVDTSCDFKPFGKID